MSIDNNQSNLNFAEEAFRTFNKIMASSRKDMFDDLNRENKGELFVIHFLALHEREMLPSELSEAMNTSTARISALLNVLEKKNHIVRNVDLNNRRNVLVSLTEEGHKRIKKEMKQKRDCMIKVFSEMGEADTKEFLRLTERFSLLMQSNCKRR